MILRLRPNSVASGSTETQLDFTEQSPQPSQTSGLMKTRWVALGIEPRLRRRRFSVAQVWSYSSTVVPGVSRSISCTRIRSERGKISTPGARSVTP